MFKVAQFDSNNAADTACKELFTRSVHIPKKKNKIKKGKITKTITKKKDDLKNEEKIKNEIKQILNNNNKLFRSTNIKTKKKRIKPISHEKQHRETKNESSIPKDNQEVQQKKRKKRKKNKHNGSTSVNLDKPEESLSNVNSEEVEGPLDYKQKKREKLKQKLQQILTPTAASSVKKQKSKNLTLRERMMAKLQAARFRYINEQLYSSDSKEAQKIFKEDLEAFGAYHDGYRQQVSKWPLNPLDIIIKSIQKLPNTHVIADFGCGDAKLAKSVAQKVHSFDLVAMNDLVVQCDMAHVPLPNHSADVVVFCLSLMGTNLHDYLLEANRILKIGGILKVAEVESRFDDVNQFIEALQRFRFKNTWKDLSHNLFYFLDFKKESNINNKKKLPRINLNPCLYKKR